MSEWLLQPWPWYVTGPLIGLMVPLLLLLGWKGFWDLFKSAPYVRCRITWADPIL